MSTVAAAVLDRTMVLHARAAKASDRKTSSDHDQFSSHARMLSAREKTLMATSITVWSPPFVAEVSQCLHTPPFASTTIALPHAGHGLRRGAVSAMEFLIAGL